MNINWLTFDKYPEDTVECQCGKTYRSHAKGRIEEGQFVVQTRKPCPGCGKDVGHVRRVSSEPEVISIGAND